jgi:hypothetical protein
MPLELDLRWQPVDEVGLEHCSIRELDHVIVVDSVLIGEHEGTRVGASYRAVLGADWTFQSLFIRRTDERTLDLTREPNGQWLINGRPAPELAGCVDIDISGTPFTNTLPMRRVPFKPGVPQRFDMAWIPLDSLKPFRDGQIYTQLDATHFRYEAADGTFTQVLTVDEHRFVVDYPTLFRRV